MKDFDKRAAPRDENNTAIMGGINSTAPDEVLPFEIDEPTGGLLVYLVNSGGSSGGAAKPTDAYSISAISETATHKYFYFEDSSLNWYVMRKDLSTNVYDYTKGTGGYESVYDTPTTAPSGSLTWASYGDTF